MPAMGSFWADVRHDYGRLWSEIRASFAEAREEGWELVAEFRQARQIKRRMGQRITGKPDPTREEVRQTWKAIGAEAREIEDMERRVLGEHRQAHEDGQGPRL